jgi:hypothetical protein
MELVFTIIIIVSILLFLIFGIPTIYDWMVYRGNHLSFIDPQRRTAAFRGGGNLDPKSLYTLFGVFFVMFMVLFVIKGIYG